MQQQHEEGRLETGVPGLDVILSGGLIAGSVFIVQGSPGAGKTILANQICFHHARSGSRALYVTLLAESHDRLLAHLGRLAFFDAGQIPSSIYFISGFDTLARDGLKGILHLLRSESRSRKASLIVLDGLFALEETAQSAKEFRKFINDLTTLAGLMGCTLLLLTNNSRRGSDSVEYTMVDGWIELELQQATHRAQRFLSILKYRGSGFIGGRHSVAIDGDGVRVLPRLEAMVGDNVLPVPTGARLGSGVAGLDEMLGGGIPSGSVTLIAGPSGIGKTTFCLHFLAGCSAEEPGMLFNFYEDAKHIRAKSEALGLRLADLLDAGHVAVERHAPTEQLLDALAHNLMCLVRQRGIKRLVVDGIDGFAQSVVDADRLPGFMAALTALLRNEGVTTVFTVEIEQLLDGGLRIPFAVSAVAQNIVLARFVEVESALLRGVVVLKVRDSAFAMNIREFEITPDGISIGGALPAGAMVGGRPHVHMT